MRRIVMFNRGSADGYFAAIDGSLDWIVPDVDFDRSAGEAIEHGAVDTILFGRRTYELFEQFWPHALDESPTAPDPHQPGRRSPEMRAMVRMLNESEKIVFSATRRAVTWRNSRLVSAFEPRAIEAMKQQPGKDIMVFGSGTIVSLLTRHALIDEYRLLISPVFLGQGRPLVDGLPSVSGLDLAGVMSYPSGNVMLRYCSGHLH
jgi:dihydrofolate reductase